MTWAKSEANYNNNDNFSRLLSNVAISNSAVDPDAQHVAQRNQPQKNIFPT
jgi:hypothetical protein